MVNINLLSKSEVERFQVEAKLRHFQDRNRRFRETHPNWHRNRYQERAQELRPYFAEYERNLRATSRSKAIEFFGGKCAQCEVSDPRILQFDHIHGGRERGDDWKESGVYRMIRDNPDLARETFQLLCCNHNWLKRFTNNELPHCRAAAKVN